jgi:hypothetical protein
VAAWAAGARSGDRGPASLLQAAAGPPGKEQQAQGAVHRCDAASELGERGRRRESGARGEETFRRGGELLPPLGGSRGRGGAAADGERQGTTGQLFLQLMQQGERRVKKPQECSTPSAFAHSAELDAATAGGGTVRFGSSICSSFCRTGCGNRWRRNSALRFFNLQMQHWMGWPLESVLTICHPWPAYCPFDP